VSRLYPPILRVWKSPTANVATLAFAGRLWSAAPLRALVFAGKIKPESADSQN
jgi:hypothetical protein